MYTICHYFPLVPLMLVMTLWLLLFLSFPFTGSSTVTFSPLSSSSMLRQFLLFFFHFVLFFPEFLCHCRLCLALDLDHSGNCSFIFGGKCAAFRTFSFRLMYESGRTLTTLVYRLCGWITRGSVTRLVN